MGNNGRHHHPRNLSDAIHQLEKAAKGKGSDLKDRLGEDFEEFRKALEDLKPHLENVKDQAVKSASHQFDNVKESAEELGQKVDKEVHKHPWMAIGVFAFVAFLIGLILGRRD